MYFSKLKSSTLLNSTTKITQCFGEKAHTKTDKKYSKSPKNDPSLECGLILPFCPEH